MLAAQIFEVLLEKSTHFYDSISHPFDLSKPLLIEFRIVEDLRRDSGSVDRGIRV